MLNREYENTNPTVPHTVTLAVSGLSANPPTLSYTINNNGARTFFRNSHISNFIVHQNLTHAVKRRAATELALEQRGNAIAQLTHNRLDTLCCPYHTGLWLDSKLNRLVFELLAAIAILQLSLVLPQHRK